MAKAIHKKYVAESNNYTFRFNVSTNIVKNAYIVNNDVIIVQMCNIFVS